MPTNTRCTSAVPRIKVCGVRQAADLELLHFADDAEGVWEKLVDCGLKLPTI